MREVANFNYYPGHMNKTKRELSNYLHLLDLVIELRDSRIPLTSRIDTSYVDGLPKIVVYTKFDLCDEKRTLEIINSLDEEYILTFLDDHKINEKIKEKALDVLSDKLENNSKKGINKKKIRAVVTGIPNVGKSTLINKLSNKKIAKVENKPGVTKSLSWLKISKDFELLDSPGLLEKKFNSKEEALKLASLSTINEKILNYQELAIFIYEKLIELKEKEFMKYYKIDKLDGFLEDIEKIGRRKGALIKGGEIDFERTYRLFYQDFKNQKFGRITLD